MIAAMRRGAGRWFQERTPRERWLLALGGAVLLAWAAAALVWQPVQARREAANRQIAFYERAIVALRTAPAPAAVVPGDPRPLNVIVTEAANGFGLSIRRLEPEGDRIRVTVDEAGFQPLVLWLEALQGDFGLRATELDMSRRPAPGVVNATLVLER